MNKKEWEEKEKLIMDKLPKVEVSLVIEGENFDINKLTKELNILSTKTRSPKDWPEEIKNNVNIPKEFQPVYEWCISEKEELCTQI